MTSTLRRHDTIAQAERRRRNLVKTSTFEGCRCCYDPNSDGGEYHALVEYREQHRVFEEQQLQHQQAQEEEEKKEANANDSDDEEEDSDDEFDYLLDEDLPGEEGLKELEEKRRAELEYQILERQVALQHGYGAHRHMHPGRVLKCAGLGDRKARDPPSAVVLHLFDPESVSCGSLDYFLESKLAPQTAGTIFLRSGGRNTMTFDAKLAQKSFPELRMDRDIPALIAIKDGIVVNTCPNLRGLRTSEDGPVDTHAVEHWLERSGVLLSQPPPMMTLCFIRPEEDALMDYLETQKPQTVEEERYDCGVEGCSKSFFHEHVGIKTSEQSGLVVKEETVVGEGDSEAGEN